MTEIKTLALISLGSNENSVLGDPTETVQKAMSVLAEMSLKQALPSQLYQTPAFPAGAGPDFTNAVIGIYTNLSAARLLSVLHEIESSALRQRTVRWGQRTLDLDLIALGDLIVPDHQTHAHWRNLDAADQQTQAPQELILPHPRVQDRAFVLVPLADVAPDWVHPVLGKTTIELRDALPRKDLDSVVAL